VALDIIAGFFKKKGSVVVRYSGVKRGFSVGRVLFSAAFDHMLVFRESLP
jgi:hypothetical protein